jgi:hypothetical protein
MTMTDREAVKLLTGLTDAELTDLGGFPGEDAFGDPVQIGSRVQWIGSRRGNRMGTVMEISEDRLRPGSSRANIRDTKGNWAWVDLTQLVVLP